MNKEAKTLNVFKYDTYTFNAMLNDIVKHNDCKDFNQNVNPFDSGLKSAIQRLTIRNQPQLNNKVN